MSITAVQGPLVTFGQETYADYNPELGPSLFWGGVGILDPRAPSTYNPGQNFGALTAGWFGTNKILTLNVIPATASATLIAAAQNTVANTAMTLASANATGLAVGVSGPLLASATATGALSSALCIDPLVASVTATFASGSNVMTVTAVAAPGGSCYNQLAIGMVLTSSGNVSSGTYIAGYGTGIGGVGTYILSTNALATASGQTVTGLFTGVATSAYGSPANGGVQNTVPFGQAGTVQIYNPAAMCSRVLNVTPSASTGVAVTFTIVGADVYGYSQTEQITVGSGVSSAVAGLKAWKYIQSITPSATNGSQTYSVGITLSVGLPLRSDNFTPVAGIEYDVSLYFSGAAIVSATGYTAAVATTPATATTGDPRGVYTLQTSANGTLRLIATQSPNVAAYGVGTLQTGLFGVPNYATL